MSAIGLDIVSPIGKMSTKPDQAQGRAHAGFDAFIATPCLPDDLLARVQRLLQAARKV
jgi:hypothetical protein